MTFHRQECLLFGQSLGLRPPSDKPQILLRSKDGTWAAGVGMLVRDEFCYSWSLTCSKECEDSQVTIDFGTVVQDLPYGASVEVKNGPIFRVSE